MKQRGLSLLGTMFFLVVAAAIVIVGMKMIPAYTEHYAVQRILSETLREIGPAGSRGEAARIFDRRAQTDYLSSVKGADVQLRRERSSTQLVIEWEKRVHVVANVSIVMDFTATALQ